MTASASRNRMTTAEYLAWERVQLEKHAFWDGEVYAMAGASLAHNRIVANLVASLHGALRGSPCAPYPSDLRIRLSTGERYVYPDVTVVCDPIHVEDEHRDVVLNPRIVIEVLSESTAGFDRGAKFESYRALESVEEIVFIAQDHRMVELYVRAAGATWTLSTYESNAEFLLPSIGARLSLDDVYFGVEFSES